MENEIEKLKQIYLDTTVSAELVNHGYEDVLLRFKNKKTHFYTSRMFIAFAVFALVIGVTGFAYTSQPNTVLYPLKTTTENAISTVAKQAPHDVKQSVQGFILLKKPTPTPTPTISPTPTKSVQHEDQPQNHGVVPSAHPTESVKGIMTTPTPKPSQPTIPPQSNIQNTGSTNSQNSSQNASELKGDNSSHSNNHSNSGKN